MDKKLYELRYFADRLARGIDPTCDIEFKEDTILNNPVIKEYNQEIKCILDKVILLEENKKINDIKIPFYLSNKRIQKVRYSNEPISISAFCYMLNENVPYGMRKLKATEITTWLLEIGYLESVQNEDGSYMKVPTSKGKELGIVSEVRKNVYNNQYSVNLYSINAQKFIVDNLENIVFRKK